MDALRHGSLSSKLQLVLNLPVKSKVAPGRMFAVCELQYSILVLVISVAVIK